MMGDKAVASYDRQQSNSRQHLRLAMMVDGVVVAGINSLGGGRGARHRAVRQHLRPTMTSDDAMRGVDGNGGSDWMVKT